MSTQLPEGESYDDVADERLDEGRAVLPYTLTGGRTRATSRHLPIEALVRAVRTDDPAPLPERRRILELSSERMLSVAELSAHLKLPIGVVRVVIGDLADAGLLVVHDPAASGPAGGGAPASNFSVLESVLNGISAL